jgi:hypothetical protein
MRARAGPERPGRSTACRAIMNGHGPPDATRYSDRCNGELHNRDVLKTTRATSDLLSAWLCLRVGTHGLSPFWSALASDAIDPPSTPREQLEMGGTITQLREVS